MLLLTKQWAALLATMGEITLCKYDPRITKGPRMLLVITVQFHL